MTISKEDIHNRYINLDYNRVRDHREVDDYYQKQIIDLQNHCEQNGGHDYVNEFGTLFSKMPDFGDQRQICKYCKKVKS